MKHKKRLGFTTKYTVIFCAVLLAVNAIIGVITMNQSGDSLKTLIRKHMLAVTDTASALVDGDMIESFTEDDVGSDDFRGIADILTTVKNAQKDSDIKYIYITKKSGDEFVFVVDPDPENPADFGEEVVYTPAQDVAWSGTPEIDSEPMEDEWGYYYSAWSPIFNSDGKVVGIVGIDFAADWFNAQIGAHTRSVVIISLLSLIAGSAVVVILTSKLRRRFRALNGELSILSADLEQLSEQIIDSPDAEIKAEDQPAEEDVGDDTIMALSAKIRSMQVKLKGYLRYIHEQAYTDSMTSVGNKTAYLDFLKELNREIEEGEVRFALAIFDINGLKATNDNLGHEIGDLLITDSAEFICRVFPNDRIFRIGGDEFVAVAYNCTEKELEKRFETLEELIGEFNKEEKPYGIALSLSHGGTEYIPGEDAEYKDVFRRADRNMYENKANYYRLTGGISHNSGLDKDLPTE